MHARPRRGCERDHRASAVGRVLTTVDEAALLEVAGELARRRQAETQRLRELAYAALAFDADLREETDVPAAEPRLAVARPGQPERRSPPAPEPAQHTLQRLPGSRDLLICYHVITIIR